MNLKVSSAKIQLNLNKLKKMNLKLSLFYPNLKVFTSHLILTEY